MDIALLIGFSLLLVLMLTASALVYSYYIYSKNLVFTKTKYSILWIVICATLIAFLIFGLIYFILDFTQWKTLPYAIAYIGLNGASLLLSIFFLISFILIPKLSNKNKIDYKNLTSANYQEKINEIKNKIGDVEKCKNELATKHKKYYQAMLLFYENILKRVNDNKVSPNEKWADIITFNDTFTHKWSSKTNYYQLLLTYQFCTLM